MKKKIISLVFLAFIFFAVQAFPQQVETETPPQPEEQTDVPQTTPVPEQVDLGKIYFPRDFVHAGKDYPKGTYGIMLSIKDELPYFQVSSAKGELLFEEMAVTRPNKVKSSGSRQRLKKEILKGEEYFRIRLTKPGEYVMAHFLIKQALAEKPPETKEEQQAEKQPGEEEKEINT
ncbi:MAG: hypothetical protein L0Y73_00810 [Candidatus Aminicenantes bacterium]|nr:hypothetical protein [Candidatus Aminicenantes bacterium]